MSDFMRAAWEEAKAGADAGGFPVGSVVVKEGRVVGRGHNRFHQTGDPTTHAEMEAIRDVAASSGEESIHALLEGAICYTTMMPCEMCAGALIRFGIARVVVAETESYVAPGTQPLLERQGITVEVGRDRDCIGLVEAYFELHPEEAERIRATGRRRLKL